MSVRGEVQKEDGARKSRLGAYMCIQWAVNSFSYINVPQNSTMMSPWTCCEPNSVNYHYCLIPSLRPPRLTAPSLHLRPLCPHLVLGLPLFIFRRPMLSGSIFLFNANCVCAPPPANPPPPSSSSSSWANPQTQKLLTAIWKVSGITRTVLIRTSWHILAKTCTYGNSIRKRQGGRGGQKWKRGTRRVVECETGK